MKILKRIFYLLLETICFLVTKILFRVRTYGKNNIPNNRNFIIVARHQSFWDIPLMAVGVGFRHQLTFIARDNLRFLWRTPLHHYMLPITRGKITGDQFKGILRSLKKGKKIGMFPESSRDSKQQHYNPGAILFAKSQEVPILPLAIKAEGPYAHGEGSLKDILTFKIKVVLKLCSPYTVKELAEFYKEEKGIQKRIAKKDYKAMTKFLFEEIIDQA